MTSNLLEHYRRRLPIELVAPRDVFVHAVEWCQENVGPRMNYHHAKGQMIDGVWATSYSFSAGGHVFFFEDDLTAIVFKLMFIGN